MKYKVKLNDRVYEVEVEKGNAVIINEYEAIDAPKAAPAPVAAAPVAPQPAPAAAAPVAPQPAPAAAAAPASSVTAVKSPLPGAIMDVKISAGQAVKKGDVVMTIEAMKMENEINAPKDGTITAVHVSKGSKVEQGTPLYDLA